MRLFCDLVVVVKIPRTEHTLSAGHQPQARGSVQEEGDLLLSQVGV
jgi:hypothetical protein